MPRPASDTGPGATTGHPHGAVSVAEARRLQIASTGSGRRSKYRAVKTLCDGIVFDSAKEAGEYLRLRTLLRVGQIFNLEMQPEFELHAPGGERIGCYRADFRYQWGGKVRIVDVKGFRTALYRWKKKHVEAEYGIRITEV